MLKLWVLVRLNFKALISNFTGSGGKSNKKKAATGIGALVLMAFISIYLSSVYSMLLGSAFAKAGLIQFLPVIMALASALVSLMFTAMAAGGTVFGNKDSDLMLSLPVSPFVVMLSKITALYIENLVFCVFMLIPAGAAYLAFGGSGGAFFVIRLIICAIFLPVLPTFFALIVGFLISWIQSHSRHSKLLANLGFILFFGVIMWFSFGVNTAATSLLQNINKIDSVFSSWLYPIGLMRDGLYGNNISLLLFVAILVIPFLVVVYFLSTQYKKILSKLASTVTRTDYKMQSLKTSGRFKALFAKEAGRLFGTPIYFFNCGIGSVMGIGGAIAAIIFKKDIDMFILQVGSENIAPLMYFIIAFLCSTICTACASISLEGKTLWILKEAPISPRDFFIAKAGVNVILIWITFIVLVPSLWYAFTLSAATAAILMLFGFIFAVFTGIFGVWINLLFPKMDGVSDAIIVKSSASLLIGIFGIMATAGIGAVLYFVIGATLGINLYIIICCAVLALASYIIYKYLITKGVKKLIAL